MPFPRSAGILLHPTSLPGPHGIGDLGESAYKFVDFLAASGLSLWQLLPLAPTGFGDSPYQCFSAFAGNPLLVSPQRLVDEGFLDAEDLGTTPKFSADKVEFGKVIPYKRKLLELAYERFTKTTDTNLRADFLGFCTRSQKWLDDYALFRVLKEEHLGASWDNWAPELALRKPSAIEKARDQFGQQIEAEKFIQYLFFRQWKAVRAYCHEKKVATIGDVPIFVAYDSADVWTNPELFKLDDAGRPTVVAGVPPDYFSATGQLWGNPIYRWDRMAKDNWQWWIDRINSLLEMVDIVRIDHFRGFAACWEVPFGDRTAERGRWVEVPGRDLFTAMTTAIPNLPMIVEDLGVITPDVEALRDDFGFPGMRVLQMGFCTDNANIDLPHNYIPNSVVYTGTHDNDTALGWFASKAGKGSTRDTATIERERQYCLRYLKSSGDEINWDFIDTVLASVSCMAIVPLQDILGLGSQSRMNLPASTNGNWSWRFKSGALSDKIAKRLRERIELYGRSQTAVCP